MWMLHFAQQANLTLSASQTSLSLQKEREVSATPKQGEVNPVWMLHFAYASFSMTAHPQDTGA